MTFSYKGVSGEIPRKLQVCSYEGRKDLSSVGCAVILVSLRERGFNMTSRVKDSSPSNVSVIFSDYFASV